MIFIRLVLSWAAALVECMAITEALKRLLKWKGLVTKAVDKLR